MRVNLRGGQLFMAKQLLDAAQIRAIVQQMRREGMTQLVGREAVIKTRSREIFFERSLNGPRRQRCFVLVPENEFLRPARSHA